MATDTLDTTERRNPDTPEFRAMVLRSREGLRLYMIWLEERKAIAVSEGRVPESINGEFPDHEARRSAFREWLAKRNDAEAAL